MKCHDIQNRVNTCFLQLQKAFVGDRRSDNPQALECVTKGDGMPGVQFFTSLAGSKQGRFSAAQILCEVLVRNLFGVFKDLHGSTLGCAFAQLYGARGFGL